MFKLPFISKKTAGGAGASTSAYGAYDYYISQDAGGTTYTAYGPDGTVKATDTTPDIWALLNSIDGLLSAPAMAKIFIASGVYTGTATFTPSLNNSYYIAGAGSDDVMKGTVPAVGTVLENTSATAASIDTLNWKRELNGTNQNLVLEHLSFYSPNTSGTVIHVYTAFGSYIADVSINGDTTSAGAATSVGLYYDNGVGIPCYHALIGCAINSFYTGLLCNTDDLFVFGLRLGNDNSPTPVIVPISLAATTDMKGIEFHGIHDTGNGSGHYTIVDNRPAGNPRILYAVLDVSTNNHAINSVNGAPYFLIISNGSSGFTGYYVQTNVPLYRASPQTTLAGTTAGSAISSQPDQGTSYKKFLVYLSGYENTTATAQTIDYPTAFTNTPKIVVDDSGGATVSTTTLTLPSSMSGTKTGWIILEGY